MSKTRVLCNVSNCKYWGKENVCQADTILVEVDSDRDVDYSMEAARELAANPHKEFANTTSETCCHTFTAKDEK